jgi:hypothetical protein
MLVCWMMIGSIFAVELFFAKTNEGLCGDPSVGRKYIPFFLIRSALFAILIEIGFTLSMSTILYPILTLEAFYLILLIVLRPYQQFFDNIGIILLEFTVLYALTLALILQFV